MRHITFSAIENIEIFVRSIIAYHHAHVYGATGYLEKKNFNVKPIKKPQKFEDFISQIDTIIKKQENKELFVDHHIKNYGGKFPIWAVIELFSFGKRQ